MNETKDIAKIVREFAALLEETGLTEIEYGGDGWHIRVAKDAVPVAVAAPLAPAEMASSAAPASDISHSPDGGAAPAGAVASPMVGTVYLSSEPGSAPFVEIGDEVSEGDTLLLIEAMKTFNEIRAPRAGCVTDVLVESGTPVEFGDPLLILS